MGASVAVANVSRSYGVPGRSARVFRTRNPTLPYSGARVDALVDVSFSLPAGSFTALLGPSGCGKSTLLHLLGALDRPTSGHVLVDGRDLARLAEGERDVYRRRTASTVFQLFNLLPTMTARENVALPLLLDGVAAREADSRADEGLVEVGLGGREGAYPYELSGGQMQRVAVARALVGRPGLLLADEPTGSLDSRTGTQILELIARLAQEKGLTVVMATHSQEAAAYATRRLELLDGRLA